MAPAEVCVTRSLIDRHASATPDKVYAIFQDGTEWTYAGMQDLVRQTALGLQKLGVKQGDHVVSWLPNGPDALCVWFAINYLGAVYVPINTSYRGGILAHVVDNSDADLIVAHAGLAPRLADIDRAKLTKMVVLGGEVAPCADLEVHGADALAPAEGDLQPLEREIMPWDTQSIIYTSGTTGPSKGVLSSYLHAYTTGAVYSNLPGEDGEPLITSDDRYLLSLPLFHVGGTLPAHIMLAMGGSISIVDAFNTQTFWKTVKETRVTFAILLGVMAQFLAKQEPVPEEKDNPLRTVMLVPFDFDPTEFRARFDVQTITLFNMTEISCPLISPLNPTLLHSAGTPRAGVECRVVDENDCEVPVGEVGELIVRADCPWTMNHGYYKNKSATARAWRNGWFHTGDGFRKDAEGNFYFVDRMKDAIRRRGENISSFEVETEVLAHPSVQECAAVAVKSDVSEDEVMVVVAPAPDKTVDPKELVEFLIPRMAHFMVPRYVRIVDALPKTPTEKVQKVKLREEGVTEDTWDRDRAGVKVSREKLNA
ncbi:ATP-dependent acyl-CoA ligase [Minwuia thermotolerans]|uniref:ATP-dependent acyl-CoA ligase n=2 Tax=Minwuia thermotolerans TaxID=2056226 RepID=A0A2M9FX29_9PROT|nr:ATP-dependent acyl-CoA ligase [Minwuia thermotolerans]